MLKLNVLTAYPYTKEKVIDFFVRAGDRVRWLLDSGAFTAWKSGETIHIDDYCRFLEKLPVKPWRYFTLDVVGNAEETLKNYETMLARGFDPLPIYTRGEQLDTLEYFYEKTDYLALGGLASKGQDPRGYVKRIMKHVNGRKAHILGFTRLKWINFLRPYSCDSSSWQSGYLYGSFALYMGNGKTQRLSRADFMKRPEAAVWNRIERLGVNPYDMSTKQSWSGSSLLLRYLCAANGVSTSMDVERHTGTKFFLASTNAEQLNFLMKAYEYQTRS